MLCDLADIKNFMAGGTDEEPANQIIFLVTLEHGVKSVSVPTDGTASEFVFENNLMYCITHGSTS